MQFPEYIYVPGSFNSPIFLAYFPLLKPPIFSANDLACYFTEKAETIKREFLHTPPTIYHCLHSRILPCCLLLERNFPCCYLKSFSPLVYSVPSLFVYPEHCSSNCSGNCSSNSFPPKLPIFDSLLNQTCFYLSHFKEESQPFSSQLFFCSFLQ